MVKKEEAKKVEEAKGGSAPAASGTTNPKTMMLVAYIFHWLTGLIVYFVAGKENDEVRFHAVQAILLGIAMMVLWILGAITLIGWIITYPLSLLLWLYGIYVGYTAYSKGERMLIPFIGQYAVKYSEKPMA